MVDVSGLLNFFALGFIDMFYSLLALYCLWELQQFVMQLCFPEKGEGNKQIVQVCVTVCDMFTNFKAKSSTQC